MAGLALHLWSLHFVACCTARAPDIEALPAQLHCAFKLLVIESGLPLSMPTGPFHRAFDRVTTTPFNT